MDNDIIGKVSWTDFQFCYRITGVWSTILQSQVLILIELISTSDSLNITHIDMVRIKISHFELHSCAERATWLILPVAYACLKD